MNLLKQSGEQVVLGLLVESRLEYSNKMLGIHKEKEFDCGLENIILVTKTWDASQIKKLQEGH